MRWLTRAFGGDARGPRSVGAALRGALLAVLDRDHDRAEELLAQAVRLDADDVDAYLALARLYRLRGEIGRAIRVHQNLLLRGDLSPERRITVLCDLGADFSQGGFLRRAIASYEEVLLLDKRNPTALRELVRLLSSAREFPRAIELAGRLARLEGGDYRIAEAGLLVQMGELARAQGDTPLARRCMRRALRRDKKRADAWLIHGELQLERGKRKAALAAWQRVPKLEPALGPRVYPLLEAVYSQQGQKVEYERYLRRLLDDAPDDVHARHALVRTLGARGLVDGALQELRTLIDRDPDDLEARATLGRLLLSDERFDAAQREYLALIDTLERVGLTGGERKPEDA